MGDFDNVVGNENKKQVVKILNSSFIRDLCHENNMKMSEEAMKEIAINVCEQLNYIIHSTKKTGVIVILRRHVERIYKR